MITLGVIVGVVLIGVASCTLVYSPTHVRFRLKVDVNEGSVVRTSSSVIRVAYGVAPPVLANLGGSDFGLDGISGNAVTIDLGGRGLLFAILRHDFSNAGYLPIAAYGLPRPYSGPQLLATLRQLKQKSGWVQVPSDALPLLIRFRNIEDSNSAQKVDASNLSASFGSDVKLESVTLELTDDPVTPAPSMWPAWLKELGTNEYINHTVGCSRTSLCLQGADFKGF